jgi:hypothetical protein
MAGGVLSYSPLDLWRSGMLPPHISACQEDQGLLAELCLVQSGEASECLYHPVCRHIGHNIQVHTDSESCRRESLPR